jgi:chorismate synthase
VTTLRYLTAGESHGRGLVGILEGLPAGILVSLKEIQDELTRRRLGHGRGPRMAIEKDEIDILSGVRGGRTLGSPLAITVMNSEWEKWSHIMPIEGE